MNENIRRLSVIMNSKRVKSDDKEFIEKLAEEHGVPIKNKTCSSCWLDKAIELLLILRDKEDNINGGEYVLKNGVDVYFGSIRVNAATLTDDLARRILAKGFERSFFAKMPDEDKE